MVASYLLNPSKRAHSLDQIALDYLGHKTITYKEVVGTGKGCPQQLCRGAAGAGGTLCVRRCRHHPGGLFVPATVAERAGPAPLMDNVEMPLVRVLLEMEMRGDIHRRGAPAGLCRATSTFSWPPWKKRSTRRPENRFQYPLFPAARDHPV
jgi:DNA polymerase I-like protein with 3'-5' exonuclease and polymerase domains